MENQKNNHNYHEGKEPEKNEAIYALREEIEELRR